MENTSTILTSVLTAVLIPTIPILLKFLVEFLKTTSQEAKKKNKQEELNKYIDLATETVIAVVTAMAQTTVDALKKEGKFTPEKQREVFNKAKNQVLNILSTEAQEALKEVYGDLNKWLNTRIEAEVKNLKIAQ